MAQLHVLMGADTIRARPTVRRTGLAALKAALARGLADFSAIPTHAVFLCLIYPIVGLVLARAILGYALLPLLFPLAAGFALVGPFAAIGFYALTRRREQGLDISWEDRFDVRRSPSRAAVAALGFLLPVTLAIWIGVAHATYVATFRYAPAASIPHFLRQVFPTPAGWMLIIVGNFVGFLFAVTVLIVSVVTFPLLVDREVGAVEAVLTSVRAVAANPVIMAVWGLIVAALLVIGSLPFFFGLAVVVPVLGHSTWHLYRKVVEPAPSPREDHPRPPQKRRYAAQFPAALFAGEDKQPPGQS